MREWLGWKNGVLLITKRSDCSQSLHNGRCQQKPTSDPTNVEKKSVYTKQPHIFTQIDHNQVAVHPNSYLPTITADGWLAFRGSPSSRRSEKHAGWLKIETRGYCSYLLNTPKQAAATTKSNKGDLKQRVRHDNLMMTISLMMWEWDRSPVVL